MPIIIRSRMAIVPAQNVNRVVPDFMNASFGHLRKVMANATIRNKRYYDSHILHLHCIAFTYITFQPGRNDTVFANMFIHCQGTFLKG